MDKDKLIASIKARLEQEFPKSIKARLEQEFPKADVEFLGDPHDDREYRSVELDVYESTARELESAALNEAREFFGPGPELHAEDGWVAKANALRGCPSGLYPGRDTSSGYHALVTVHAHGPLAGPDNDDELPAGWKRATADDAEPEGRHRRRYPAEDVPGPDTLPEPAAGPTIEEIRDLEEKTHVEAEERHQTREHDHQD
jgi:hypothetical protein